MTTRTAPAHQLEARAFAERTPTAVTAASSAAVKYRATTRSNNQTILSIRASVPEAESNTFIADALRDVRLYMHEHHARPAGPPFSICRPRGREIDIEAGWPTAAPLAGTGRIHSGAVPRCLLEPETGPYMP